MRLLTCIALFSTLACSSTHLNRRSDRKALPDPNQTENPDFTDKTPGGGSADTPRNIPVVTRGSNPFSGTILAIDTLYAEKLEAAALRNPAAATRLREIARYGGTGLWLDTMESLAKLEPALIKARAQQLAAGKNVVLTIVVYDLPNRDCFALASNGEITYDAWSNNGDEALNTYKTRYIDPLAAILKKYSDIRTVAVIEPDSLPNAVTNAGQLRCSPATLSNYKKGIAYALKTLNMPHTALYLDAAHSGWLGYNDGQRRDLAVLVQEVLQLAGGSDALHGFATNVANYTPLSQHSPRGSVDPTTYFGYSPVTTELAYIKALAVAMNAVGIQNKTFIIDTGRNGAVASRMDWGVWCNVANARLGLKPTVAPTDLVDAYLWVKPPGESDGSGRVSRGNKGIDDACEPGKRFTQLKPDLNQDSIVSNFVAGDWFEEHLLVMLGP